MMKKILVVLMVISLLALCGCKNSNQNGDPTNPPTNPGATEPGNVKPTTGDESSTADPIIDWETPIDIDDSVTEPEDGEETDPAVTDATEPDEEGDDPTSGQDPTEVEDPSEATDPVVTDPPAGGSSDKSGPIELPMIPG